MKHVMVTYHFVGQDGIGSGVGNAFFDCTQYPFSKSDIKDLLDKIRKSFNFKQVIILNIVELADD